MTSNDNKVDTKPTPEEKISLGQKFKATREGMGLSVQDAASRLNLSPRFIVMLENEDLLHSNLPATYLRGYLRSYSRLLNISEQAIVPIIEKLAPTPVVLTTTPPPPDAPSLSSFPLENNLNYARAARFLIFLVLFTSVTTWWYVHGNTSSPTIIAVNQTDYAPTKDSASPITGNEEALQIKNVNLTSNTHEAPPANMSAPPVNLATKQQHVTLASEATVSPVPRYIAQQATPPVHGAPAAEDESPDELE